MQKTNEQPQQHNVMTRRTALALAVVGVISFEVEQRLHVIVRLKTDKFTKQALKNIREELGQFFPQSCKVLLVYPEIEIDLPVTERQFFSYDQVVGRDHGFIVRDAQDREIPMVRWCHRPTGVVCQIDKKQHGEIIRQYPGPLKIFCMISQSFV